MIRSYDSVVLYKALSMVPDRNANIDCVTWLANPKNIMLVEGDNVGLATFEYDGLLTVHWFYTCRGRAALDLAEKMIDAAFSTYGAKVVRGLTDTKLRGAQLFARKLGFKSYGTNIHTDGTECELFIMTKDEFYNKDKN